jgi:ubiquinone/menaquinone biosynthesis C-methylase UbiE
MLPFILIAIVLGILTIFSLAKKRTIISPPLEVKTSSEIYDKEYSKIYDKITFDSVKLKKQVQAIDATSDDMVLDIGSGTGHLVNALQERGVPAMGVDISYAMLQQSKTLYPHRYVQGDVLSMPLFFPDSFSYITCFNTFYYFKHKDQFLQNAYSWLQPNGKLILQLQPFGPFQLVNREFKYKGKYVKDRYIETITTDKVRRNEHRFYIEHPSFVIDLAKQCGFMLLSSDDDIYVFQK